LSATPIRAESRPPFANPNVRDEANRRRKSRIAVERAFADTGEAHKAKGLVERDRPGLGVRHHAEAADAIPLIHGKRQDVT
jgi:hypothetical protein